ncbi:Inner membrane protein YhaI [Streptomyces sp. enrichment culture]|uniref:DUF805 domain-containing protein n=1 Tax=Streptomyces toxytricini TaxID=67369 RepID=A0ABW8EMX7_STRT5|nr:MULTISPECIES: DUF805 domain-containing protein [Streptomyces]MBD3578847.1 DUF805 domain-containing protein [Streptomyces sp. KD18]GGS80194.1 membrane protein [Streptomyces toxytricini]
MHYYTDVLKKYAVFSGRARRQEFWMFVLFNIPVAIVLMVVDFALSTYPLFTGLYLAATFVPNLAVTVRRLHDTGKSGWWYFISFVPFIGGIWLLVLMASEGDANPNQYGPSPKAVQA